MKNWSTEHTKEIKSWLDIDTYRKFEDLTLIRFYHELWARTLFFKSYRENFESKALMGYFSKIKSLKKNLSLRVCQISFPGQLCLK